MRIMGILKAGYVSEKCILKTCAVSLNDDFRL